MIAAFLVAALALAAAVLGMRISGALNPQRNSGVDRLDLIDCDDGSGPDESRWTPESQRQNRSTFSDAATSSAHRVAPGDMGIDDAVVAINFDIWPKHLEELFFRLPRSRPYRGADT
jgi:hypothetical protein